MRFYNPLQLDYICNIEINAPKISFVVEFSCASNWVCYIIYEIRVNHTITITELASQTIAETPSLLEPVKLVFPVIFAIIGIIISVIYFNLRIVYDVWTNFTNTHFRVINIILIIIADLAILLFVSHIT